MKERQGKMVNLPETGRRGVSEADQDDPRPGALGRRRGKRKLGSLSCHPDSDEAVYPPEGLAVWPLEYSRSTSIVKLLYSYNKLK